MIYIAVILLVISFIAKACVDKSGADLFTGKKRWKNRTESWANKYRYPLEPRYNHWYYFGLLKPKYREDFPFSTTALVFLTDYWHFMQFIYLNCLFASYSIFTSMATGYNVLLCFVAVRLIYAIVFNLTYERNA